MSSISEEILQNNKFHTILTTVPKNAQIRIDLMQAKTKPSFIMVGSGVITKRNASMDYTKMLLGLSKPAAFVFEAIMDNRKSELNEFGEESLYLRTNYSKVKPDASDAVAVKYFTKGYKELREKDMVIRLKQGEYLINPMLVISGNNWQAEQIVYNNAVNKLNNINTETVILETTIPIKRKSKTIPLKNPAEYTCMTSVKHQEQYAELQDSLKLKITN